MAVRPAKTQISLVMRSAWSESSLCAQWVAKDPNFLHANSDDSDQTARMPRLIWVFAGCTAILLVLSWGGSNDSCCNFCNIYTRQLQGVLHFIFSHLLKINDNIELQCFSTLTFNDPPLFLSKPGGILPSISLKNGITHFPTMIDIKTLFGGRCFQKLKFYIISHSVMFYFFYKRKVSKKLLTACNFNRKSIPFLFKCSNNMLGNFQGGPRQANLVLITYASSEGSGEPAHPRSLARTFAARSYKQWVKRNLQTESQISGSSEWLGMRS